MAKLAKNAYQKELNGTELPIQFGHWDSGKKGLLAGERLSIQLKELESNYMKLNTREFELTKSISIKLFDPTALVELIKTGTCSIELPEWLFNLEFPDEKIYAMRVKSIAVSLPCITGPQSSTNVKLKMLKSWIGWKDTDLPPPDFTNVPSINEEIITSSAVNDPAVFEMNLRDERYMPFENQDAVSQWEISLPNQHEFDYSTINDLILQVKYVAKGISGDFSITPVPRNIALEYTHQLMSWKHDFPQEWYMLTSGLGLQPISIPGMNNYIPYRLRFAGKFTGIKEKMFVLFEEDSEVKVSEISDNEFLTATPSSGELSITLSSGIKIVKDIWLVYKYNV